MPDLIKVLIVDDIPSTLDNLQKLLSFEPDIQVVGTGANGKEGVEQAKKLAPDIVLMDVNMPVVDGIQATETLAQEVPGSPVIIMSVQGERDYLRRAMQSGAREFLIKPFSGDELIASIRRVYQLEQKKESFLQKTSGQAAGPVAAAPTDGESVRRGEHGQVYFFYSGKGGVGKSLIAANLAVSMANETKAKVALVDLDLQFGDIGVLLNLDHSQGITDLIENIDHMDQEFIREIMVDGPFGIKVLLTPISPELADLVTVDHIRRIFSELRKMFDYIIVDSSCHLGEINLEVLDHADKVVVVTSLSIPAIKNTKLALKIFDSLSISPDRVVLLLNKSDAHSEFNKESVEANLRFPIAGQIPNDAKLVINSVNRGNPFVTTHPESEISQRIRELVGKLIPPAPVPAADAETADRKPRKGLFARR
ncbi:MAG: MinD/ParA family protein [Chloroflexi bacterium]|nr:MAG: MinD/ParA family protein [Chloroflexota bacterium]